MKLFIILLLTLSMGVFAKAKIGSGVVKNYQEKAVLKAFQVDWTTPSTISLAIGSKEASIVRNGVGDYTITFVDPFQRAPISILSATGADHCAPKIHASSISAIQIKSFASDLSTPKDCDINAEVHGWESSVEY